MASTSHYYEVKRSKSINIIFLLILLGIVQLVFNPIKYLKTNYYEVKNMKLPSYIEKIVKVKSDYGLNYIGHMEVEENIVDEMVKMEDSFKGFFDKNSITDYVIEKDNNSLLVKTVLPTNYKLYDSFKRAYRINVMSNNIISDNIPKYNKEDFWSSTEEREVVAYILLNNENPKELYDLLNRIDNADLRKIFLKFRFILVWILLFFLVINLVPYINAVTILSAEKKRLKRQYQFEMEESKKRIAIQNRIEELIQDLVDDLLKDKISINNIIYKHLNTTELEKEKLEIKTGPKFVTKELDINHQYEFFKDSLDKLEKYKKNINNEEEAPLKICFKDLYDTLTISQKSYFPYKALQTMLLEHNINVPQIIKNISEQVNDLNISLSNAIGEYKKHLSILSLGLDGERRVLEELKMYDDYFQVLSNTRIKYDDMSVEVDNIILCPQGVFLLEVKNLGESGKYSLKISKDGKWSKIVGTKEVPMNNVTSQQNRHVAVIQRLINRALKDKFGEDIPYIFANPIIVIANDNVDIYNESDVPIYRISNVYRYIINTSGNTLSKEYISEIINAVKDHQVSLKKYPVEDYLTPINLKYSSIVALQKKLLSIFNISKEFTDYFFESHEDKIKQLESLKKELPYDYFYQLSKTFNNANAPKRENLEFNYVAMKDTM